MWLSFKVRNENEMYMAFRSTQHKSLHYVSILLTQLFGTSYFLVDRTLSWLGTCSSMNVGGVKLALWSDIPGTLIFNELHVCGSKSINVAVI
jgi:hypothetical protein